MRSSKRQPFLKSKMMALFRKMRSNGATLEVALTMTLSQMAVAQICHKMQTVQILQFQVVRVAGAEMSRFGTMTIV